MNAETLCASLALTKALQRLPSPEGKRFTTIFQHGTLLVEIYAPRGVDPQQPHTRDEVYFVATGGGEYVCSETRTKFGPTDLLFAATGVEHRFENFSDDLAVWVLFYGPEGGEVPGENPEMSEHKFTSVAPCFSVADVGATMHWYEQQFGFHSDPFPQSEPYLFAILFLDHVEIMLQRIEGYEKPDLYSRRSGGVWDAYVRVTGVKELYESVREQVTIIKPLRQPPYGAWEFEVKDPNGYVLVFSEMPE